MIVYTLLTLQLLLLSLFFYTGVFSESDKASLTNLHELLEGLCVNGYSGLRRKIEQDFTFFANAAKASPGADPRERKL